MMNVIFNADDFGMSKGVNAAIYKAHTEGVLNSTSIMINLKHVPEALELAKEMPSLNIGLHGNLTVGKSLLNPARVSLLVDEKGNFNNSFIKLLWLSIIKPNMFKYQVRAEIKAQIDRARELGINLSHIDSHHHVHMIPAIFKIFRSLQKEYGISRIRFVNENPLRTIKTAESYEWVSDGGLLKSLVLSTCAIINHFLWGFETNTYFYSIIHTCKLSRDKFKDISIPGGYDSIEIGIHPGIPEIDKQFAGDLYDDNVLNEYREKELEALMDPSIIEEFN